MKVANKLEPEIKAKRLKPSLGMDHSNFKSKTLQLLVPNSKRLRGYTGNTQEHKDLHITSCLHGIEEGQTSTRQIRKGCQQKDLHITSRLHGMEEGQTSTRQIKKGCQHKDLYIYRVVYMGHKSTRQIKKVYQNSAQSCYKAKMKARQSTRQVK